MKFLLITLFISNFLYAGGETGSGRIPNDLENAWFLGEEPIVYCTRDEANGLSPLIEEAFKDWRDFFTKYGLDQLLFGSSRQGVFFQDLIPRKLSLNMKFQVTCNKPQEQILFTTDPLACAGKNCASQSEELGAALRYPYNHQTYRTGGVIWLHPSTLKLPSVRLKHLILHELGHVFGMPHNSTYVMYDKVAEQVKHFTPNDLKWSSLDFGKIESPSWPYDMKAGHEVEFAYEIGVPADGWTDSKRPFPLLDVTLPNELTKGLVCPKRLGCKVKIRYDKDELVIRHFSLIIEEPSGKRNVFSGDFDLLYSTHPAVGPSVFTTWKENRGLFNIQVYLQQSETSQVDQIPVVLPATGFFNVGNGKYPVSIDYDQGIIMKLYIPTINKWVRFFGPPWSSNRISRRNG